MAFRAICAALLLSSLPIAGCGTVANLVIAPPAEGGKSPFGGVTQDLSCIENAANGEVGFSTFPMLASEQHPQVVLMLFAAADLPCSLIGDVLTWPYTAAYCFINQPVPVPPLTPAPPQPPAPLPAPTAQEKRPAAKTEVQPPPPLPEPPAKEKPPSVLPEPEDTLHPPRPLAAPYIPRQP